MKKSITRKTILAMALRMSIVIMLTSAIGYWHVSETSKTQTLDTIEKYVLERGQRERQLFSIAETNHQIFKQEFLRRLQNTGGRDLSKQFHQLVEKNPDGAYRNRKPFDGTRQPGIFIGREALLTPELQRRIVILYQMISEFGPAWRNQFQDTYVTLPENAIVLFWPERPTWVQDAKADLDMTKQEYMWVANQKNNPTRKSAWTGLFYDVVGKLWMVSCETPVDISAGRQIATIGHDVLVDQVINRSINDYLPGTKNIIFRGDGRLIAHPDLLEKIQSKQGNYNLKESANKDLRRLFALVSQPGFDKTVIEDELLEDLVGVYKIPETNWFVATLYPKSLAKKAASDAAFLVALLGIISLILEVLIVGWILRKKIAKPLIELMEASKKMAMGDRKIRLQLQRDDELGALAHSFEDMAAKLTANEEKLAMQNARLEKLVEERTADLEKERAAGVHATRLAALGQMAGGVAHEINNPLAIISLSAEQLNLLVDRVDEPEKTKMAELLKKIELTVDRMARIVHGLRSFSRDGTKDPFVATSLKSIIEETLVFCRQPIEKRGIQIKIESIPDDLRIRCQPTQISQVLVNLLNNACDAVENLPEKWILVGWKERNGLLELIVTDSGRGISPTIVEKIFQPFFTTKPVGKGTGIGLSVSYGIIENHGGKISLNMRSEFTQFVIQLPLVANVKIS